MPPSRPSPAKVGSDPPPLECLSRVNVTERCLNATGFTIPCLGTNLSVICGTTPDHPLNMSCLLNSSDITTRCVGSANVTLPCNGTNLTISCNSTPPSPAPPPVVLPDRSDEAIVVVDWWERHEALDINVQLSRLAPSLNAFLRDMRAQGTRVVWSVVGAEFTAAAEDPGRYANLIARKELEMSTVNETLVDSDAYYWDSDCAVIASLAPPRTTFEPSDPLGASHLISPLVDVDDSRDVLIETGNELMRWSLATGRRKLIYVGIAINMCIQSRNFGSQHMQAHGLDVGVVAELCTSDHDFERLDPIVLAYLAANSYPVVAASNMTRLDFDAVLAA